MRGKKEDGWEWREEFWRMVKSIMASLQRIICLVTGGASGLGRATAQRLIRNGARVVIADLPTSDGDNVAKELGENSVYFSPTGVSETECIYKSCSILLLSVFFSLISSYFL